MNNAQKGGSQTVVALNVAYAAKIGGGTIAGASEMHLLAPGALAIFDQDNNLIAAAANAAAMANVTGFYIAQGMPTAAQNPRKTVLIDRNTLLFEKVAYRAPVAQVSKFGKIATVGTTGFPSTPLNGTFATVVITDTSSGMILPNRQVRVEVPVYSTDTIALVGARLAAAVNASEAADVLTATFTTGASDDYFTFTGVDGNTSFEIGWDDVLQHITVWGFDTQGQKGAFAGVGTNDQVVRMLLENSITEGDDFRDKRYAPGVGNSWFSRDEPVTPSSGLTFDLVTIQWSADSYLPHAKNHIGTPVVYLAEVVGGTGNAVIESRLGILRAKADAVALPTNPNVVANGFSYT